MKIIKKFKKEIMVSIIVFIISVTVGYFVQREEMETISNTYFTYDETLGRTIIVGPDADKWIPVEEYHDDSVQVDFGTVYMHGDTPMYRGTVDGEPREATEGYWNAMLLATQPEVFFGWVYIGGD